MTERTITLASVLAGTLWIIAALLTLAGTIVAFVADSGHRAQAVAMALMVNALLFSMMAATATMRMFLRAQNEVLRELFRLANGDGDVRKIRQ